MWLFCIAFCSENRLYNKNTQNGENFDYLTYRDKISDLVGNIFETFIASKKLWDGLPVFRK